MPRARSRLNWREQSAEFKRENGTVAKLRRHLIKPEERGEISEKVDL
jgi:hypothetical protein